MSFPQDLLRFLALVFFKPLSLEEQIRQIDPTITTAAIVLARFDGGSLKPLRRLVIFYALVLPILLCFGTGALLSKLGMSVNWLNLTLYLFIGIALGLSFGVQFCVAFLLSFSVTVAIWSSISVTVPLGIFFSLMLGFAYGLRASSAAWGVTAGLVYSIVLGLLIDPISGLSIGAAFLIGYFRIIFYLVEAPLSWTLATFSARGDALTLWRFHPILWDEVIWLPLPGLDRHLRAIQRQDEQASRNPIAYVQASFRQRWAAETITAKPFS
ncbi:MAG: hypothetical protein ACOYZ6_11220 [Chloroflexota bacterium]